VTTMTVEQALVELEQRLDLAEVADAPGPEVDLVDIETEVPDQIVRAGGAGPCRHREGVEAALAKEIVDPVAADNDIVTGPAKDQVVAGAAVNAIVAAVAVDAVVAAAALDIVAA